MNNLFIFYFLTFTSGALGAQAQSQPNPSTQQGLAWVQHILQACKQIPDLLDEV